MRLARYVKFRPEKFGGVLFETRSERVFTLNPTAAAIVRDIQAGSPEEQVVEHMKESFRDPRSAIAQESTRFIADLRQHGLVQGD